MKTWIIFLFLTSIVVARADFSGSYSVVPPSAGVYSFTSFQSPHNIFGAWVCEVGAGLITVDTTLEPQTLGLNVDNATVPWGFFFQTIAVESGTVSFNYHISGQNVGTFRWFYRDTNDAYIETAITNLVSTPAQAVFPVIAGKQFGFNVVAGGANQPPQMLNTRDVTISNFSVTAQTSAVSLSSVFLKGANSVLVSWPSPSTGWGLQVKTNLATTNWMDVLTLPSDDGTNKSVTISAPIGNQFFRLIHP